MNNMIPDKHSVQQAGYNSYMRIMCRRYMPSLHSGNVSVNWLYNT